MRRAIGPPVVKPEKVISQFMQFKTYFKVIVNSGKQVEEGPGFKSYRAPYSPEKIAPQSCTVYKVRQQNLKWQKMLKRCPGDCPILGASKLPLDMSGVRVQLPFMASLLRTRSIGWP